MKLITYTSCAIAVISGVIVADSARLIPPLWTTIFAVSAVVSIWGLLAINRKYGR